jgi:hypothetical protein
LHSSKINETKARDLGLKIGSALDFLHQNGVVLKNLDSKGILMSQVDEASEKFDKAIPRIKRFS